MIRDAALGVDVVNPNEPIGLDEFSFLASLMTAACRASLPLPPGILAGRDGAPRPAPATAGGGAPL
jgi:hypothetical protein